DTSSPYSYNWNNVASGTYTIVVKATDNDGGSGSASVSVFVSSGQACEGAGSITHERWTGISGTDIASIPLDEPSDLSGIITLFEAPQNTGDNYGTRIRGYICPPVSGSYTFWISGNDRTELWLSTSDNPGNKQRIAYTDGYTDVRQWNKFGSQESAPVTLTANQRYY